MAADRNRNRRHGVRWDDDVRKTGQKNMAEIKIREETVNIKRLHLVLIALDVISFHALHYEWCKYNKL